MPLEENCVFIPSFYTRTGKKKNDCCLTMRIFDIYLEINSKYLTLLEEETFGLTRTITVLRKTHNRIHFLQSPIAPQCL